MADCALLVTPENSTISANHEQRFRDLTADFDATDWEGLTALASERRLSESALERLAGAPVIGGVAIQRWLRKQASRGLLVESGRLHAVGPRGSSVEAAFAIAPEFRALTLRPRSRAELADIEGLTRGVLGDTSVAAYITALYSGELALLERALPRLKRSFLGADPVPFAQGALREAVCSNFDADWFERTWGDHTTPLATEVLTEALVGLAPVSPLYAWALERSEHSAALCQCVCEHALLRGELPTLSRLAPALPAPLRPAFEAARCYLEGDLAACQAHVDDWLRTAKKSALPNAGVVAPLLSLLRVARGNAADLPFAKRFVGVKLDRAGPLAGFESPPHLEGAARALRGLLRDMSEPDAGRVPQSAHQLRADAPAWEVLISGLSIHLHCDVPIARAAWARRLGVLSARAYAANYAWLAEQALALAKALNPDALAELSEALPSQSRGLLLADLLEPRPQWEKSLAALSAFAEGSERSDAVLSRRIAWFVDMTRGELTRPAIEEFRGDRGWTLGRRVDADELAELAESLPEEDQAVLRHLDTAHGRRRLRPDALAALCGHPRVFNGARGRLPVEVVRGTCRIETSEERGHLVIRVEPQGAREGVNVVVEGEARLVVYRVSPTLGKLLHLLPEGLRVPDSHADKARTVLARLAPHVEIRSERAPLEGRRPANSTPCLRISPEAGAFWVELGVRPFGAEGRFFPPGLGREKMTAYVASAWSETERDFELEKRRCGEILSRCPSLLAAVEEERERTGASPDTAPPHALTLGEDALFSALTELRESTLECELEWQNTRPLRARGTLHAKSLQGTLRRVKGWYIAKGSLALDEVTNVALADLATLPFSKSGRFVRLPNGDFAAVEKRVAELLRALRSVAEAGGPRAPSELRISDAAFGAVRELSDLAGLELDASARAFHELVDATRNQEPNAPEELRATLRPYQLDGYRWLHRSSALGLGVCLADDMGLGKTLQILALLLMRATGGPALVVAPTSVCSNWLDEIARFAPSLQAVEYTGKQRALSLDALAAAASGTLEPGVRAPDVVIVSYALLQQDAAALGALEWHTAVLDEAQFIKNAHSLRARAAFGLNARYRVAMTGTPIENHLGDLYSIFHFVNPTLLGSWKHFQLIYLRPIERDKDTEQEAALKRLLAPFILRRTKSQVLSDLPPVTNLRHEVRLSEEEALRYALLRRQIHEKLRTPQGKRAHKFEVFAEITRLRRFCCHPQLVFREATRECSKVRALLELVEELRENGHRALVFSQFVDFLELVREELDERQIPYLYLDGSTPKPTRSKRVAAFQAGEANLFLMSVKAGGFGLNLTAADYVIHADPWWNPAVEAQATDRAHRIGQQRPVTVYRLITKDTIEEQIVELHREKRALADALLEGSDVAASLNVDDLVQLLLRPTPAESSAALL